MLLLPLPITPFAHHLPIGPLCSQPPGPIQPPLPSPGTLCPPNRSLQPSYQLTLLPYYCVRLLTGVTIILEMTLLDKLVTKGHLEPRVILLHCLVGVYVDGRLILPSTDGIST